MKTIQLNSLKLSGIILTTTVVLFSCGASREEMSNNAAEAKAFADSVSTTIQNINKTPMQADSARTFVRTADLSFKVKDVRTATYDIERIVSEHNGYVTSSVLESTVNFKNSSRVSKDSMVDITNYSVHNDIVIRIPNANIDKTLSEISVMIDYLDYRKIKADDVTKDFQFSKLSENRFLEHKKRLEKAIDHTGKKLDQMVNAENDLLAKQEQADVSRISTLELAHDVSYSTITIAIYQRETTKKETYAYLMPIEPYTPNFGSKLFDAGMVGCNILSEILLFFVKLWPLALVTFGVVALIKFLLKRKWAA